MKKFISMVMAAAMVVSLVPATAFAANAATFKTVGDKEITEDKAESTYEGKALMVGEIQIKITDVDTLSSDDDGYDVTLTFDNAEMAENFKGLAANDTKPMFQFELLKDDTVKFDGYLAADLDAEDDSIELTIKETGDYELAEDDVIVIEMADLNAAKALNGALIVADAADVTVEVDGDFGTSEAMPLITVLDEGLKVTLKKVNEVAEEEEEFLKSNLILEANVDTFVEGQVIELKLNSGFEWTVDSKKLPAELTLDTVESEEDCLVFTVADGYNPAKITIDKEALAIEAVDAKVGDIAKITVKVKEYADATGTTPAGFKDTVTVDAMEVIGETVTISVDEDEDVPVFYSGVKAENNFLNDDEDHMSLEVTIEESVAGALDVKKDLELMLPEGVYVTNVKVTKDDNVDVDKALAANGYEDLFKNAYEEGEEAGFVFERKTFTATDDLKANKPMEFKFQFELIAVPGFVGDVVLTMDGPAFDEAQEVTIAKFVAPYTVEATQNDMIIDYRNTEVPTDVVVKEAEAGLWNADVMNFFFDVDYMDFEDDAVITVNEESEMEVKEVGEMGFVVDEESDDEAAVVTISGIELYMSRSLAAGAYDLELSTSAGYEMMTTPLFTAEKDGELGAGKYCVADIADWKTTTEKDSKGKEVEVFVGEAGVVKEAWINVVTAGRDQDDASFTKKVVVTIGSSELVAGEEVVALDVPAYINAAGYTMLPVRAVAVALGIHNNNVIWDQATKTVTILYGQRIITMAAGSKVINVNGSAIPASAAVEVVNGRTFLGLRDLATALGVVDITWDAATQTATLNGNK